MKHLHVMVGILRDREGRVLISRRTVDRAHPGRWEFPGGKLEAGEAPEAGLRRELREELGIVAGRTRPLIRIHHDYPDFRVLLDVRELESFGGEPQSLEGQALRWLRPEELDSADILEADAPIIRALRLPDALLVTPDPRATPNFLQGLGTAIADGVRLVQLRAPSLDEGEYLDLARQVLDVCRRHDARLLLNADPAVLLAVDADGIHLNGRRLARIGERPVPKGKWLSASCHDRRDLELAARCGVDFVLLGPVMPTATHPQALPLGWHGFERLVEDACFPVYALGGMHPRDIERARLAGGQGIAAIRSLWNG